MSTLPASSLNPVAGYILFVVLFAIGFFLIHVLTPDSAQRQLQIRLFAVAMVVRFLLSIAIYQVGLVNVLKDEDGTIWEAGWILCMDWVRQGLTPFDLPTAMMGAFDGQHRGYAFVLAGMFFLSSLQGRLSAAALNCFCGGITVVLVYRLARVWFSDWAATRAAWMACIFPSMLIWCAQTIKEPVVVLLEVAALYGYVQVRRRLTLRHALLCLAAICFLYPFRFYAVYLLLAAAALSFIPRPRQSGQMLGPLALAAIGLPLLFGSGILARHQASEELIDLDRIQSYREIRTIDDQGRYVLGSTVETGHDIRTPGGFVAGTSVGAIHLLFAPFPWQMTSVRAALTMPEVVYWWWLVFAGLIPGAIYCARRRFHDTLPMLVLLFGFGLLYSMMFGNVGLVYRQRAQLLPYLLIVSSVGLEQRALKRLARRQAFLDARERLTRRPAIARS